MANDYIDRLQLKCSTSMAAYTKRLALVAVLVMGLDSQAQTLTAMDIAPQMIPGWNLGNTLEAGPCSWLSNDLDWETGWQPTKTSQKIIDYVKAKGFRSVRIPCSWNTHMDANHRIKSAWMRRVKQVVDYCIKDSLYVMLNDHWDNGWIEVEGFKNLSDEKIERNCELLRDMWTQIATAFADYDEHLLFAGMNEPNANDAQLSVALKRYHQTFVDAVRSTGGKNAERVLVVQGPCTNIDLSSQHDVLPDDPTPEKLMIEVHYYDPYNFVMMEKDEDWGYRFFYWGKNNHVGGSNYNATWGEETYLQQQMRKMRTKYTNKGIPVVIGEYGANRRVMPEGENQEKHDNSLQDWYEAVTQYAINNGCVPMVWDTNGNDPVIDRRDCSIGNPFAYNGIMEGVDAATWPYTTGIESVRSDAKKGADGKTYNLMGIPVNRNYRGIVVQGVKKYFR